MSSPGPLTTLVRYTTPPSRCGYLPTARARLAYRVLVDVTAAQHEALLTRGWRRFGCEWFRPVCSACTACRSLRIHVPPNLVVKSQVTDIVGIILQLIRRPNGVHRTCRNRKSRGELLSTSEVQWSRLVEILCRVTLPRDDSS